MSLEKQKYVEIYNQFKIKLESEWIQIFAEKLQILQKKSLDFYEFVRQKDIQVKNIFNEIEQNRMHLKDIMSTLV